MPPIVQPYHADYRVRAYELAPDGLARLTTLCDYLQDAAGLHAETLGLSVAEIVEHYGITWMLAELRVEVARYPALGETVHVETWPSGHDGRFVFRDFILTGAGGSDIARATTRWMTINLARRRPTRVPTFFTELRLEDRPRSLGESPEPLVPDTAADTEQTYTIRHHDLDVNGHLNHVYPVAWIEALGATREGTASRERLSGVSVAYRAEAREGEAVRVEAWAAAADGAMAVHLSVPGTRKARTVARARATWMPPAPAR